MSIVARIKFSSKLKSLLPQSATILIQVVRMQLEAQTQTKWLGILNDFLR